MPPFEQLFPGFTGKCAELNLLLRAVTFLLFVTGTVFLVGHRFTAGRIVRHLTRIVVLTAVLVMLPTWGNESQELLQSAILDGLGVNPELVYSQYLKLLVVKRDTSAERSWWDIIGDFQTFSVDSLITGVLWLVSQGAAFLLFWAYIFQKVILFIGYALAPLFIGFMAISGLRSVGSRYLMNLVGVLLWPLGWAVAALITQGILDFMTDPSFGVIDPTASLYRLQATFGLAVLAFWIAFSTVASPIILQRVFTHGVLAGAEFLHGAFGSFFQTAATTAGAAAVASATRMPLVTFGAAAMAAGLSTLSTAAGQGSAGAIIIAGSGLPPRSARGRPGDDITGDRAVRELISKTKGHYF